MKNTVAYQLGAPLSHYRSGDACQMELVVTEECNLCCRYCYEVGKNSYHRMPREVALRAVDFFLGLPLDRSGAVIEFTGGEATLEMDLVEEVAAYFQERVSALPDHPFKSAHVFLLGTNGTTYPTAPVQRFLWRYYGHVCVAMTIDGTKRKHDMNRVFADGRGSYDQVLRGAKLWIEQYPHVATKVTFASEDLPYLGESILHLWGLGITEIAANVVFEDVFKPGDVEVYETQLMALANIALDEGLWRTCRCSLFEVPRPPVPAEDTMASDHNFCGTGRFFSVDSQGRLFPCLRFQEHSLVHRPGRSIGDIYSGLNRDALRTFFCLRRSLVSPAKCLSCEHERGCAWCSGFNYDVAASDTAFHRATFICEFHKAEIRANQYYWSELERRYGVRPLPCEGMGLTTCPI